MRHVSGVFHAGFRARFKRADTGEVSPEYHSAAIRQGLSNPLSGIGDPRLARPDLLTTEHWIKNEDPQGDYVIFRYELAAQTIQYYGKNLRDGTEAIGTFKRDTAPNTVEHIIRTPNGDIVRSVEVADRYETVAAIASRMFTIR